MNLFLFPLLDKLPNAVGDACTPYFGRLQIYCILKIVRTWLEYEQN